MILLTARDLKRQFDVEPVFTQVSFDLRAGEKVGLVGPNGAGKSTLMRILAGVDSADFGEVIRPAGVRMAFLQQQTRLESSRTLLEEAREGLRPLLDMQARAHELAERIAHESDPAPLHALQEEYDHLHQELERLDAYHLDHREDEVLQGLDFSREHYDRSLDTFSGGQQNRALLARILLTTPDLMLLDEPTNHLDIQTTQWLERYLAQTSQAVLVISHDRYFLDRVTQRTIEIHRGGIEDYPGNFSQYWTLRDERHKVLRRAYEKQQEFIADTEEFIRRNYAGNKSSQAKDREKKLERLERVQLPPEFAEIRMGFSQPTRTGDWVLRAEEVGHGFGQPGSATRVQLFTDVNLQVDRGDRLGILGPNGSGKTTLLRILLGEMKPEAGTVRKGTNVDIGYFDQQLLSVDSGRDAVEAVRPPRRPELMPAALRSLLARFGIQGELGLQTVGAMSGGERTKVALARLAAEAPNVLVMDEPTNHLDFWACASLEKSLREFAGTVLFVSHDRYFLDQVATKILAFEENRWFLYEGNFSNYQQSLKERLSSASSRTQAGTATIAPPSNLVDRAGKPRRKRKFPYRNVTDIEDEVSKHEAQVRELEAEMSNPETHRNVERMRTIQSEYDSARAQLTQLLEHWEEAVELN